jgi:hypothetical protein
MVTRHVLAVKAFGVAVSSQTRCAAVPPKALTAFAALGDHQTHALSWDPREWDANP